jgi:cytochrome c oxidase subunit 2
MLASVRVVEQAEYDAYIEELLNREPYSEMTPEDRGRRIWQDGLGATGAPTCAGCHSIDGSLINGPSWQGIWMREGAFDDGTSYVVDEEYIRSSILDPNAQIVEGFNANVMYQTYAEAVPAFEAEVQSIEGDFGFDAIADIIAFMQTLEE